MKIAKLVCCSVLLFGCICPSLLVAQEGASTPNPAESPKTEAAPTDPNSRVFGVLPNYRTADGQEPYAPISPHAKMAIAAKDSFDWPNYGVTGMWALIDQAENKNPTFGQGLKGYSKRYITSYADLSIGNILAEGIFPIILHEDPRYFRQGVGRTAPRIGKAMLQILIGRKDSGKWGPNFSELLGGAAAAGISNAYYADSRTLSANVQGFVFQVGNDAISNVLKEFWPDIKQKFFTKKKA